MKVLVTGAGGMLGRDLLAEAQSRGIDTIGLTHAELDITDPESVAQIPFGSFGTFDALVNCAAYTAVDRAEEEEALATEINGLGVGYLAAATQVVGARFVQISTDFVFDGTAKAPYQPDDLTNPLSAYGRSKLIGERATLANHPNALIFRTAWLYGTFGKCFPKTMIRAYRSGRSLRVVADQVGNPTSTLELSRVLIDAIEANIAPGIYHASGPDTMSWYDFACLAIESDRELHGGPEPVIEPIPTEAYPTPAVRPRYSVLSFDRLAEAGIAPMKATRQSLAEFSRAIDPSELV
jgi:dTDP-4-dehydrorhamnose reductase